ncbi:MAG: GNAT family N-acetyltransferase [Chloroflexota bacterium]
MSSSDNFIFRPYQPSDMPDVWQIFRDARLAIGDMRPISLEDVGRFFQMPGFDPDQDAFVFERDGEVMGYADIQLMHESGKAWSRGTVRPDHLREGIGTELIRQTEAHFLKRMAHLSPSQPLALQRITFDSNPGAMRLIERQGYACIHVFYEMEIDFDQPVELLPFPEKLVVRRFDADRDGQALYQANQETFATHWGFEPTPYEAWLERELSASGNDSSLWLILEDDGEIAGFSINCIVGQEAGAIGEVNGFGVRPGWRRQGLGLALLKASFALFEQQGYRRAGLAVDAGNESNAIALYQRAGMRLQKRTLYYRKMLRGVDAENPPNG